MRTRVASFQNLPFYVGLRNRHMHRLINIAKRNSLTEANGLFFREKCESSRQNVSPKKSFSTRVINYISFAEEFIFKISSYLSWFILVSENYYFFFLFFESPDINNQLSRLKIIEVAIDLLHIKLILTLNIVQR